MSNLTVTAIAAPSNENPNVLYVSGVWESTDTQIDRVAPHGFSVPRGPLAARLVAAIEAGAVYADPTVTTDGMGATYVASNVKVWGRTMADDLTALGF